MVNFSYRLNSALLDNLVRIKNLVAELNNQQFSALVLANFEKDSRAVSAHASTSIEGNPLPLTDVRRILKSRPARIRDTEKEILNYNTALEQLDVAVAQDKVIDQNFICTIQGLVTEGLIAKKNHGKIRTDPVVVNDPRQGKIVYIPPNAPDVPALLQELLCFLAEEQQNVDPLILAGLFHKQFVIIHPFMDGNGRTTRLLTKYLLARMGLDTFRLFSFENYYNKNITKYFASVGLQGDYYELCEVVDFTDWLIYFTDGIIDELLRVQKLLQATITPQRILPHEHVILKYVKSNGSVCEEEYAKITKRARSTRILDFHRLVEKGQLVRHNKGRATYYTLSTVAE
jgi:Fic family protein